MIASNFLNIAQRFFNNITCIDTDVNHNLSTFHLLSIDTTTESWYKQTFTYFDFDYYAHTSVKNQDEGKDPVQYFSISSLFHFSI